MSLPTVCPGCQSELKETAKGHCLEKRRTPCGWVRCTKCRTVIRSDGRYFEPPAGPSS